MYYGGFGVPRNFTEAVKWYRKAAEQGNAEGQNNLAFMCFHGQGVPQDSAEAFTWYRKSAEQGYAIAHNYLCFMAEEGNAIAQFNLGLMREEGKGVPQDYAEAHKWYSLAARSSDNGLRNNAIGHRDALGAQMTPAQIAEAQKRANKWKPRPKASE